ncbi:MAG TPA: ABC transporter permease/substrate-binding protein [Vicinamibacterales bacterium]|nr:ABC transporter permease/substrate-binding protein [Vicinamibacterales bacterium]
MDRLVAFWFDHRVELATMLQQHVALVSLATAAAAALGIPAGIAAAHRPRAGRPIIAAANISQTIPSLALLGFLLPLPLVGGVGPRVALVALVLYALLPIVRGTVAGLRSIEPAVREAGVAMGMTPGQLLRFVELPLALPSIVAGVRIAVVTSVGTATIAAAVGAGGLGELIFRGLSMVDATVILAGAIPAAVLALVADGTLTWLERRLAGTGTGRRRVLAAAAVAVLAMAWAAAGRAGSEAIVVGSKNFTEQVVLGELVAQALEREGLPVTRRLNLGGTFICDRALRAGDIDIYVEYTGTALTAILREPVRGSAAEVLARTRERYADAGLSVLAPFGFNNTFAILVRRADAARLGLTTIGDLARVDEQWTPGFGYEFIERADGYRGLMAAYDLSFAREPRVMDLSLMYRALASGEIDVAAGDATSALIDALDLAVLVDDRGYFPPYHAVPVVRTATLLRHAGIGRAMRRLAGRISDADMRALNRAVDVERRDVRAVVRAFLDRLGEA